MTKRPSLCGIYVFANIATDSSPTSTGGVVIAGLSKMFNLGKRVAVRGDVATCGNCNGTWQIIATGTHMIANGNPVVLLGDKVACACGKNYVCAVKGSMRYDVSSGSVPASSKTQPEKADQIQQQARSAVTAASPLDHSATPHSAVIPSHHRYLVLVDETGQPLSGIPYTLKDEGGREITGKTDASGQSKPIEGNSDESFNYIIGYGIDPP